MEPPPAEAAGAQLSLPARLLEEALVQDDQQLRLDEVCAPGTGSAEYSAEGGPHFEVERMLPALPPSLDAAPQSAGRFMRQGVLEDIQRVWRSYDSTLLLWRYADPSSTEVLEYQGVTQQIVAVATARPKAFVSGVSHFLVLSTPVEVSLHALCFAPGGDRLLPPVRTQHAVVTDDVVVGAIAADNSTGRIFLGGSDGCIHELQYFDDEARWFGRPRKCRRSRVSWNLQSQLPTLLRKVSEALFGPADGVAQLVVDGTRGLLLSLSTASSVTVFRLPPGSGRGADGRPEEPPPVQLCSIQQPALASEMFRIRAQLFPGLAPSGMRGSPLLSGAAGTTGAAATRLRIVKLLPLGRAQGGSIVACAVAEDGTRLFLRGVFRSQGASGAMVATASNVSSEGPGGIAAAVGEAAGQPTITGIVVHHVRFFDASSPSICVKDAIYSSGITLLLCQMPGVASRASSFAQTGWARAQSLEGPTPLNGDVLVTVNMDVRALARRQSRGRSPWLASPLGFAEQLDVIKFDTGTEVCQAIAVATCAGNLPQPIEAMYDGVAATGMVLPVLGLSELAQQQLLPPPRFVLLSNLGLHVLTRVRPIEVFLQQVLKGDVPSLRDFTLQYTAEQTCALCFQVLTAVAPQGVDAGGATCPQLAATHRSRGAPPRQDASSVLPWGARDGRALMAIGTGSWPPWEHEAVDGRRPEGRDANDELLRLHVESLLLTPQLAPQMGFVQTWPAIDSGIPQALSTSLGHSMHPGGAHRISGRVRGLCLYLSRILRPLWLAPVMAVAWPSRPSDGSRQKRRRDDWWPPPPQPPPDVRGSQWQCSWSKAQRSYVQGQLVKLSTVLERCRNYFVAEDASAGSPTADIPRGAEAGNPIVDGILLLIATAIEAIAFLELVAGRTDYLGAAPCPPEALVRFAELTFRDLVCQPEARWVLQQLMRAGVVACRQLHAKCPRLFSAVDLEVQEAYELLAIVQNSLGVTRGSGSSLDMVRLNQLVQRALRTLQRHAARVDLAEATTRLRMVGACKGLVALCVRIARARDPRDESLRPQDPTSARVQQLHYARLECYQVGLEIFEDLFVLARQHRGVGSMTPAMLSVGPASSHGGGGLFGQTAMAIGQGLRFAELPELLPVPMNAVDAMPILDALLRHCLENHAYAADELFHFCILKWMTQRELPVYRYESPYLEGFLEGHARDQPEMLCRYFRHRGRWAEACDAYMALARSSAMGGEASREDKVLFLQSAAFCARMPGSNRRVEPILQALSEASACEDDVRMRDGGGQLLLAARRR